MKLPIELPSKSPDRKHVRATVAMELCRLGTPDEIARHCAIPLATIIDSANFYLRTLQDDRYTRSERESFARHLAETSIVLVRAVIGSPVCDGQQAYL
jgi:hypothetical protein